MFLDTNVVVYLFDTDAPSKQQRVREIFSDRAYQGRLITSTQVLQEFYVSVTRKLAKPLGTDIAYQAVRDLTALPIIQVDAPLILSAISRSQTDQLSFWDALIIQAALAGGATYLYTEDLQDGRIIESMRIVNPFSHTACHERRQG
ncbi:MAG: PIN domain-containing protein [Nitrospinae bacterium]|nr:PIN domain-containing protein [Nitrospinota bacterium]